jgi:hypothetical protein
MLGKCLKREEALGTSSALGKLLYWYPVRTLNARFPFME